MQFNLVRRDGSANITVVVDGELYPADETHPEFEEIVARAIAGDESVVDLFDLSPKAAAFFADLSDKVRVANSRVYVGDDEVDGAYADQILRFVEDGLEDEAEPLVAFLEKVYTNTTPEVRDNLSRWLGAEEFTILPNGNILGYRGLNADYTSKHAGPGIVNGERVNGHHDNSVGNVIEMDSHLVVNDASNGCASGLHVGTYDYAKGWAGYNGVVVSVEVDPAHVRSVPFDCNSQKMRVFKFTVKDTILAKVEERVSHDYDEDSEEYDEFLEGYDEGYTDGSEGNDYRY